MGRATANPPREKTLSRPRPLSSPNNDVSHLDVIGEVVAGVVRMNHENPVLAEAIATERKLTWNRLSLTRTHLTASREMDPFSGLQV